MPQLAAQIESKLKTHLDWTIREKVSVEITDTQVILTGQVTSYFHKQLAQQEAITTFTTLKINNQIEVIYPEKPAFD